MFTKDYKKKLLAAPVAAIALLAGGAVTSAHTVEKGETLSEIANMHNMKLDTVINLNPQIKNPNMIYVGEHVNTNTNTKQVVKVNNDVNVDVNASQYEKDLLARLVEAEAVGEPYAGKVAVAWVVLNRVAHPDFPDTITSVIHQPRQFTPVSNGSINNKPSADSIKAVNEALASDRSQGKGSLFFYNSATATSRWLDSKETTIVIGNHTFKR